MIIVTSGVILALAGALIGLMLLGLRLTKKAAFSDFARLHPILVITALTVLIVKVVFFWRGPRDLVLDAGILVLVMAFLGGGLLFALRVTRVPRPLFVIGLHGAMASLACALLVIGLFHAGVV